METIFLNSAKALGPLKRTDILLETEYLMLRVQVKAKQGATWPDCKGIYGSNIFLVLVDYQRLQVTDRPKIFILNPDDWSHLIQQELATQIQSGEVHIDRYNIPTWVNQLN